MTRKELIITKMNKMIRKQRIQKQPPLHRKLKLLSLYLDNQYFRKKIATGLSIRISPSPVEKQRANTKAPKLIQKFRNKENCLAPTVKQWMELQDSAEE